jgi:acyl carrier protein
MTEGDALQKLLAEFLQLPPDTPPETLSQQAVPAWDSLASVQLITEVQSAFHVEFDLDEIETLTSYAGIREALRRHQVSL